MDRSSEKKLLNGEIIELADIINQIDLTDIYRIFHPNTKEYTFFSAPHETFPKTDHILSHKASLNRLKKNIEITLCILSDHHGLNLDFNNNINNRKSTYS
jgi:exonuclease III